MKITVDEVNYIAKLAKLKFTEDEAKNLAKEFESVLEHFATIDNFDLSDVESYDFSETNSEFRKDEVEVFEDKQKLFRNTKKMNGTSIEIPKVIE
ncbi:MAG: aspartyl-tRNA(Asn)/glutamyl-tRNA(Gln) amidotransferase subunit [Fusobacteriaceae bacterium]|jgi:aspartyl-tRNA(Asn)/glutamyl-tRNA(Gln) amidotransferase subunit C|nr:aspartyl-tRNA(Asn)/glutamyl-tRNA(Gln) amidotransferase subunit [Fusobacteriaceae bacterium]